MKSIKIPDIMYWKKKGNSFQKLKQRDATIGYCYRRKKNRKILVKRKPVSMKDQVYWQCARMSKRIGWLNRGKDWGMRCGEFLCPNRAHRNFDGRIKRGGRFSVVFDRRL